MEVQKIQNYRTIALNSILGKILNNIITTSQGNVIKTSDVNIVQHETYLGNDIVSDIFIESFYIIYGHFILK